MAKLIEQIRKIQSGEATMPAIGALYGMKITEVGEGTLTMEMEVDERYANAIGTLHGGVICDLADAAMGTAFGTTCEENESYTTIELKCNYLRPVWKTLLTAKAWIVSRGKTIGLVECEVRDPEKRLIAKLSSSVTVLRGEKLKGRELRLT